MAKDPEEAVLAPVRAYFDALNGHDLEAVTAVFAAEAAVMPNEAPTALGAETVRATYADRLETFDYQRQLHVDDWIAVGDLATVRCHTTGSFTPRAEGRRIDAVSRELFVLQRVSGTWRIRCYMFNRDASPERAPGH